MQIYQVYDAECVSKIKTILSSILYSVNGTVCLQLTQLSCDDRENVHFILLSSSNRKYESLTNAVRSWNNGMRCMSYYVLMNLWYD